MGMGLAYMGMRLAYMGMGLAYMGMGLAYMGMRLAYMYILPCQRCVSILAVHVWSTPGVPWRVSTLVQRNS